ncbi:hypothetical protein [uncultured Kordia sp.]|uniref:hypothetical protein n=1 Tax=uncultured Kordia sp. TaxID=507699 RepID=UPI002620C39F|nr:hypothetical protein [uncultured Kordia sp.]
MTKRKYRCSIIIFLISCALSILHAQELTTVEKKDLPEYIIVTDVTKKIEELNDSLAIAKAENNTHSQIQLLYRKARILAKEKQTEEAKKNYTEGIQLFENTRDNQSKVKFLTGLGALSDLEGDAENAEKYFKEAIKIAKQHKLTAGITWVLFHNGENYIQPYRLTKDELIYIVDFANRYLYSSPQLTLAASHWLINQSGDQKKYAIDGHVYAGLVYRDWGQFDKSLEQFYLAQKVGEQYSFVEKSKYSPLLNISAIYDMQGQREKSLEIIKKVIVAATKDKDDWALAYALKDLGITLMQSGEYNTSEKQFLACIPIMEKLNNQRGVGVCYSNLSNIYLERKEYGKTKESIAKALKILKATNYDQLYASTLLVESNMYQQLGDWGKSAKLINQSLEISKRIQALDYVMGGYIYMMNYYKHKDNATLLAKYADSLIKTHEKYYKETRIHETENLKIRYETEKKEAQLIVQKKLNASLNAENTLQKRLRNTMFFILLLSSIVLLLFFNRYKLRNRLMHEQEKRNLIEKKQLEEQMNHKQRELATMTLQMLKKNELLQQLSKNIKKLEYKSGNESQKEVKKLKEMIQSQNRLDQDWSTFKIHFDGVHPNFFNRLREIINNLTLQDERHCCYIKMGLSTKEIAQLMNISSSSVQMARYRLKKKLELGKEEEIYNFINSL